MPRWFDGVRLNFAENMLFSSTGAGRGTAHKEDAKVALTEVREAASAVRHVTYGQLRAAVARLARAMRARGVGRGDRVVVVAANSVETAVVFLAATWLGAIFSSSSTDMGVKGILQRAAQVDPKVRRLVFVSLSACFQQKTRRARNADWRLVPSPSRCCYLL